MGDHPTTELELTCLSFGDVDQFSEWEKELGWDIEGTQLSVGVNEIRFDHFDLPGLLVSRFHCRQSMQNLFALPQGMVLMAIPRKSVTPFWNGNHVPPSIMPVLRAQREHWVRLPSNWDCYEFIVSEELIQNEELLPPQFLAETVRLERAYLPLIEPLRGQFIRRLDTLFDQARRRGSGANGMQQARLFDCIVDGLHQVVEAGMAARDWQGPRPARRADLVRKGRDWIASNLADDLSVGGLARDLGVSYRALHYAFRDSLGLSPYQYIQTERLHAARRQLKTSTASVTEACFANGFNTPSRFARQYARLFGELPSKTRATNGTRREPSAVDS